MSLAIDALRLAAIEALRLDPVIAGIVGVHVYDSRIAAVSDGDPAPLIAVYTESDEGDGWSANNGGPPFNLKVDLVLEIMFQIRSDEGDYFVPETDRTAELKLGVLRSRAVDLIAGMIDSDWSRLLRRHVVRRVAKVESNRFRTDDAAIRAAYRLLTLTVEVKDEDYTVPEGDTGPFLSLPEPLRSVARAMAPGSSGLDACQTIAALMVAEEAEPFEGVTMTIRPGPRPRPDPTDGAEFGAAANPPQA